MTAVAAEKTTMPAHVLRAADLDEDQLADVLRHAARMKRDPYGSANALTGRTLMMLFEQPAAQTRVSFAAAAQRLGMLPLGVSGDELGLGRGESLEDTARVLSAHCSAIALRTSSRDRLERFAAAATVPVINARSDAHHPCQALADLLTLHEQFGRLEGLRVACVGAASSITHSLLEAGARAGMSIAIAAPRVREPDGDVVAVATGLATLHGGTIEITDDPRAAVQGAHAVYCGSEHVPGYEVDARLLRAAGPDAVFMHALPARRGEEVSAEVIDGGQSIVFEQAANRLPVAQALVHDLVRASEH